MASDSDISSAARLSWRVMHVGLVLVGLAVVLLGAALVMPVTSSADQATPSRARAFVPLGPPQSEMDDAIKILQARPRALIRPAQVQAAVKDTGAAAQLAKRLKLQGVVALNGEYVAYVDVQEQGVKAVRVGEPLLDFVIKDVTPGKVTLSLEGVEVVLGH